LRRVRYAVAMSLDGYIAGPKGEIDWIISDPDIDFGALYSEFDTAIIGRRTFETMVQHGNPVLPGMKTLVFSRTLRASDYPKVTIVADAPEQILPKLRMERGKDIWLFGGGLLFRSLAAAKLVDTVEVSIIPVLLGGGTPLLPIPAERASLKLIDHTIYKTGIVSLKYGLV
jgi:dihydrofolate reductase